MLKNVPNYGLRQEKVSEQLLRVLLPSLTCCVSGGGCGQSIDGVGENNAATQIEKKTKIQRIFRGKLVKMISYYKSSKTQTDNVSEHFEKF